jgi:hypothetical protein
LSVAAENSASTRSRGSALVFTAVGPWEIG